LTPLSVAAQEEDIQARIDSTLQLLARLDELAGQCLEAKDATASDTSPCAQFLAAVDGEIVATYLQQCTDLRAWRDAFVSAQFNSSAPPADSALQMQHLVGVEYVCGENALKQRTQYVALAFAHTQEAGPEGTTASTELNRRLAELEFDSRIDAERRALQDSVEALQRRRAMETARQMQQLENELIRQQITPPPQ